MIRNVVFDIGGVLITYEPYAYVKSLGYSGEKADILLKAIFGSEIWPELDRGTYNFKEATEIFKRDTPGHDEDIERVLTQGWFEILTPIEETVKFLLDLKADGYKIYLLSNFSSEGFDFIEQRNEFLGLVDGKVISSHVNYIKPEKEIYEILLKKYDLVPEETVFIDDLQKNLDAATELGIHGILFEGAAIIREKFQALCK